MTAGIVVQTTSGLIASLAALLVVGRYRSSLLVRHLVLVQAFILLAVANLLPNILPALVEEGTPAAALRFRLRLVCIVLAALSLAAAALAGNARLARRHLSPVLSAGSGLIAPALGILLLDVLRIEPAAETPVRVMHAIAGLLFALAAIGFYLHRRGDDRQLQIHLAVGALLAAACQVVSLFDPAQSAGDEATLADAFRVGFYAVLLAGAVGEIRSYWQRVAVLEERRRLARDLHDGVAQELAFIATEAVRPNARPDQLARIAASATRALDESRRAISALTRPLDLPLDEAVAEAAEEVAGRVGMRLKLDLAVGLQVPPQVREELVRILREAMSNAARHAGADSISVVLAPHDSGLRLQVIDDGAGFTPRPSIDRLGIATMTERATAIGGELSIASEIGSGTIIELDLPIALPA